MVAAYILGPMRCNADTSWWTACRALWGTVVASFLLLAAAVGATLSPWEALLVMAVTVLATAIPSAPG